MIRIAYIVCYKYVYFLCRFVFLLRITAVSLLHFLRLHVSPLLNKSQNISLGYYNLQPILFIITGPRGFRKHLKDTLGRPSDTCTQLGQVDQDRHRTFSTSVHR